jgi:hypothetical protein
MVKTEKPPLLEALCLLSFLGSGAGFIICFITGIFFSRLLPYIIKMGSVPVTFKLSSVYFLAFSMFFAISLFGVFKMWNLKKSGFFIYVTARLAIIVYPLIMMGPQAFSSVVIIFSLLFIFLYASQLKKLKPYSPED